MRLLCTRSQILANATAAKYADGVSLHWYEDHDNNVNLVYNIHKDYPYLPILGTEVEALILTVPLGLFRRRPPRRMG